MQKTGFLVLCWLTEFSFIGALVWCMLNHFFFSHLSILQECFVDLSAESLAPLPIGLLHLAYQHLVAMEVLLLCGAMVNNQ